MTNSYISECTIRCSFLRWLWIRRLFLSRLWNIRANVWILSKIRKKRLFSSFEPIFNRRCYSHTKPLIQFDRGAFPLSNCICRQAGKFQFFGQYFIRLCNDCVSFQWSVASMGVTKDRLKLRLLGQFSSRYSNLNHFFLNEKS